MALIKRIGALPKFARTSFSRRFSQVAINDGESAEEDVDTFREEIRTFAQRVIAPHATDIDKTNQ